MTKTEFYDDLASQLRGLLEGERDMIANAANLSALLYQALPDVNWAGFYLLRNGQLVLGPFQGRSACTRIDIGKGVCGKAAELGATVVVENVHGFSGHIACDDLSISEIVLPIIKFGSLIGVLDLDSPVLGRFDALDQSGLETLVAVFVEATDMR